MAPFTENQALAISKKIVLLEISLPIAGEGGLDVLLNYEAGIWFNTIYPGVVLPTPGTDGVQGYYANQEIDYGLDVTSVKVNNLDYASVASLAELRLQEESFYYDTATTKLYIHFTDWHQPNTSYQLSKILIGVTTGFCNADNDGSCYYDGIYYEPRIISIPSISKQKDPSNFGILRFQGGAVVMNNADGYFDKFGQLNAFRQLATIKFGYEGLAYADFQTLFVGYIENYHYNFDTFNLNIQDRRKLLSRKVPIRTFAKSTYAYLNDDDANKPMPIAYGKVRGAKLVCLNRENGAAANYDFMIIDVTDHTLVSVQVVMVGDTTLSGGQYSYSTVTGLLTIATAILAGNFDVKCDFTAAMPNGLDVIKDLAYLYAGTSFIPTNYNISEYNIVRADCRSVGKFIDKETEIYKVIEEICKACDVLFFIQNDGKYSARYYDANRIAAKQINTDEWIGDPEISIDESKFLSSVTIKYNNRVSGADWWQYVNTTYETAVYNKYKSYQADTIETILTESADAIEKSTMVMSLFSDITPIVKRKTKMQNGDLEIGDFIIGSPQTRVGRVDQLGFYELMGINKNFSGNDIELTMRYVKPYVAPVEPAYQQGFLLGDHLYGDKLYGYSEWI